MISMHVYFAEKRNTYTLSFWAYNGDDSDRQCFSTKLMLDASELQELKAQIQAAEQHRAGHYINQEERG